MRQLRGLATTALVVLFFAEAQRAFFGSLFGLVYDAVYPSFRPAAAALAVLPLAALAAPLIPLARRLDRAGAMAAAAVAVAVARVPMTAPGPAFRLLGAAFVLAGTGLFLTYAVGHLDRRSLGTGAVLGLVVDQLLRLAGTSYDLSLRPGWLPIQIALSLALIATAVHEARATPDAEPRGFERRAGGLRLRGALALGALLFLDLHVLGAPAVVARWSAVPYPAAGIATAAAGGFALALVTATRRPGWGRSASLALAAVLAAAPLTGLHADGAPVLALMALGHLAALLLIPRALDPASGRRGGRNVIVALGLLVGLTAAYALTFYRAAVLPAMPGPVPLLGAAGLIVAGALLLLPRPGELRPLAGPAFAAAVTAVTAGIAAALALLPGGEGGAAAPTADSLRVATYNVHYGYDEGWRFDPGRIAETIDRVDVDVIALQEVPIGLPSAYGIDLPLWLGERTRMRPRFSATAHDLLGEAVLARVALRHTEAVPLPDHGFGGEPAQVLRASLPLGSNTVAVLALHLSVRADVRWRQLRDALEAAPRGAAIVLGDLNARETDPVPRLLRKAGFHDAFRDAGRPAPTFPAGAPDRRIDWIWVRGLTATAARVDDATASDHRLVVATVRVEADGR